MTSRLRIDVVLGAPSFRAVPDPDAIAVSCQFEGRSGGRQVGDRVVAPVCHWR